MNTNIKNIVNCVAMGAIIFVFAALCLFLPKPEFLESERREPAKFPELSLESIMKDGAEYEDSFMKQFDSGYSLDNFPFRDFFKELKTNVDTYVFSKNRYDKDGVFVVDGVAAEYQETINKDPNSSYQYAADRLTYIYNKYIQNSGAKPYISIIPDKGYFLSESNGFPTMDYEEFIKLMLEAVAFADYIDITGTLSVEDYYKTDTHWRQENLIDVAKLLVDGMGGKFDGKFTANKVHSQFNGYYADKTLKPMQPDDIYYLDADYMKDVVVYDWSSGRPRPMDMYNMDKANGKDSYDMYLGGEKSLVTIENPNAKTDKELVIFRDSYGRSIIPLLTEDYAKITIIDIRYMKADNLIMVGGVKFTENTDVLFLYSTLVLNASSEMKNEAAQ